MMMSNKENGYVVVRIVMALMILVPLPLQAQEISGTPGAPSATTTVDGELPPESAGARFRRRDQPERQEFQAVLAAQRRAAQRARPMCC